MRCTPYKFGPGVTEEVGHDVAALGLKRVLVVTDAGVTATGIPQRVLELIRENRIEAGLFDGVSVEPTDSSGQSGYRVCAIVRTRGICGDRRRQRDGHNEDDEFVRHISRAISRLR
jgi:alcohol dehydrogenase class IV